LLINPNALSTTIDAQGSQSLRLDAIQILPLRNLIPKLKTTLSLRFNVTHDCLEWVSQAMWA
jgi:hypothetical protein